MTALVHGGDDHDQQYALYVVFAKSLFAIWKVAPQWKNFGRVTVRMIPARSIAGVLLVSEILDEA